MLELLFSRMHPKDEDVYPVGTVVRIKKTGQFAIIRQVCFQFNGRGFLNYLAEIEGHEGLYALYHDDVELEALPNDQSSDPSVKP
jgi:hypothetical protein